MPGPEDVVRFARSQGLAVELFSDLNSVRTVVEASDAMDRSLGEVGNTVLVTVREEAVVVIVPGDRRVDGRRVGEAFGADPSQVTLATTDEAKRLTGYEIGLLPPFGHERNLPLLVDENLLELDTVLLPSGAPDALIQVDPEALTQLPNARVGLWSDLAADDAA